MKRNVVSAKTLPQDTKCVMTLRELTEMKSEISVQKRVVQDQKIVIDHLRETIKSLRAALKPIIKINPNEAMDGTRWAMMNINAVRESKRILDVSDFGNTKTGGAEK